MNRAATIKNAQATLDFRASVGARASAIIDACPLCQGDPSECCLDNDERCASCELPALEWPDTGATIAAERALDLAQTIFPAISADDRARLARSEGHQGSAVCVLERVKATRCVVSI